MKLKRDFFDRNTLEVAKDLLGKVICRKTDDTVIKGRIVQTEAYVGEKDNACHARFGRTKRTEVMYGRAGHAYIYLCYGIHNLLNIVTEKEGRPEAVLIRRIAPIEGGIRLNNYGPGNLTKFFSIDRNLNGEDLIENQQIWIENDGFVVNDDQIEIMERIGVEYAGDHAKLPWRFVIRSS